MLPENRGDGKTRDRILWCYNSNMKKTLPWFTALVIIFITFGTIYAVTQQAQRREANYPQIQIAQDTAAGLNLGKTPENLTSGDMVDPSKSLAPFVIIYDKDGKVVDRTVDLNGQAPEVPLGVLTAAVGKPYHTVTWQPQSNIRIAAVTVSANDYYVLSGRSLAEVEKNENKTFSVSLLGCAGAVTLLVLVYLIGTMPRSRR